MMKKIMLVPILGISLLLCACSEKIHDQPAPKPSLSELRHRYIADLRDENVQVIHVGETMRVVLPSDNAFQPNSANLTNAYRPILHTIAKLIKTYETVNVKVAAYSDNVDSLSRQQALTTRQAQVIASYLWALNINARLTYAVGYNRENPVASNGHSGGRADNRRVEISFRFYPPQTDL